MSDDTQNPFGGQLDLGNLQQMLGSVTERMQQLQADAAAVEVEGQAGAGMVTVLANGKQEVLQVRIAEEAMADRELLEDLLAAAVNDALARAREQLASSVSAMAGGLPLPPGLF